VGVGAGKANRLRARKVKVEIRGRLLLGMTHGGLAGRLRFDVEIKRHWPFKPRGGSVLGTATMTKCPGEFDADRRGESHDSRGRSCAREGPLQE